MDMFKTLSFQVSAIRPVGIRVPAIFYKMEECMGFMYKVWQVPVLETSPLTIKNAWGPPPPQQSPSEKRKPALSS